MGIVEPGEVGQSWQSSGGWLRCVTWAWTPQTERSAEIVPAPRRCVPLRELVENIRKSRIVWIQASGFNDLFRIGTCADQPRRDRGSQIADFGGEIAVSRDAAKRSTRRRGERRGRSQRIALHPCESIADGIPSLNKVAGIGLLNRRRLRTLLLAHQASKKSWLVLGV